LPKSFPLDQTIPIPTLIGKAKLQRQDLAYETVAVVEKYWASGWETRALRDNFSVIAEKLEKAGYILENKANLKFQIYLPDKRSERMDSANFGTGKMPSLTIFQEKKSRFGFFHKKQSLMIYLNSSSTPKRRN